MNNYLSIFKNKKVVITGHTGFKGVWLSLWMQRLGANVVGISDSVPTQPSHFDESGLIDVIDDRRLDIRDRFAVKQFLGEVRPDFIFHLAAQPLVRNSYVDPIKTWETNTLGTIHLLDALRDFDTSCSVVMITSDKCYNNVEWVWGYKETDELGGPDPYSASKGAAELVIRSYVQSYFPKDGAVRIAVGRAGNVIGGGDWAEDRIIPDCMRAWANNEVVSLRNPNATRPWQHVLEPLSGYINLAVELSINNRFHGEPFNFGPLSNTDQSVGVLVNKMSEQWDSAVWEDVSNHSEGPYESSLLKLNCDKALHMLRWHAVWEFERTLSETLSWYKNYYVDHRCQIKDLSISQIDAYTLCAKDLGLPWAQ